jgi:hypothetical protein
MTHWGGVGAVASEANKHLILRALVGLCDDRKYLSQISSHMCFINSSKSVFLSYKPKSVFTVDPEVPRAFPKISCVQNLDNIFTT